VIVLGQAGAQTVLEAAKETAATAECAVHTAPVPSGLRVGNGEAAVAYPIFSRAALP
jgi:hypothetical protein